MFRMPPRNEVDPSICEHKIGVNIIRYTLWILFKIIYGLRFRHADRVPASGPIILAPTHSSFWDPPMIGLPMRRRLHYFTRDKYCRGIIGATIRYIGAFPVNLDKRFDRDAYEFSVRKLEEGGVLVLFPEGTRSSDGLLGKLQAGVANLALETGATIVPVSCRGSYDAWPRSRKYPRICRKIIITYHHPIPVEKVTDRHERRRRIAEVNAQLERVLGGALLDWKKLREKRGR